LSLLRLFEDLIEQRAIVEVDRLHLRPAAEIPDREEREVGETPLELRGDLRIAGTIIILPDDLLGRGRVEEAEIGFGSLARAFLVDIRVEDGDRRFGEG